MAAAEIFWLHFSNNRSVIQSFFEINEYNRNFAGQPPLCVKTAGNCNDTYSMTGADAQISVEIYGSVLYPLINSSIVFQCYAANFYLYLSIRNITSQVAQSLALLLIH